MYCKHPAAALIQAPLATEASARQLRGMGKDLR